MSTLSSLYDPLGFAAPFILPAKKILQELCQLQRLGWDDEIPHEYEVRWSKWRNDLQILSQVQVNRSFIPPSFGKVLSRQFHLFSDASFYGYGAVAYFRLKDDEGRIHCVFLIGKSRLAPVKMVTIPRLELVAAVLCARLGRLLIDEIEDKPDIIIYHTDSTTVILNEHTRFHVFVANQVQQIRDLTDQTQWRYMQSSDNPADHASRGLDGKSFLQQHQWIQEADWPEQSLS